MKSNRYIKLSLVVYLYFFSKICAGKVIFQVSFLCHCVLELQKAKQKAFDF